MSPVAQRVYTAAGRRAHYAARNGKETYCRRRVVPLAGQSKQRRDMLVQASVCPVCEKREELLNA